MNKAKKFQSDIDSVIDLISNGQYQDLEAIQNPIIPIEDKIEMVDSRNNRAPSTLGKDS